MTPLLNLEKFTCRPHRGLQPVLHDFDLAVTPGELVLCCGPSGSGKSTLAQFLGGVLEWDGPMEITGRAQFAGADWAQVNRREFCQRVASVWQHPERQMLTGLVEEEIAFALEQLGQPPGAIRRRLAEVIALLGCAHLLGRHPASLSGGEQQRVALAAAVAQGRDLLILDEPTAQLDPVAAESLLGSLHQLHRDFGLTIVLMENRLSSVLPLADRVIFLETGRCLFQGPPEEFVRWSEQHALEFLPEIPAWFRDHGLTERPLTLRQAMRRRPPETATSPVSDNGPQPEPTAPPLLEVRNLHWAYEDDLPILHDLSLEIHRGRIFCLLGENGAGKSTLVRILLGALRPEKGQIFWQGQPENPPTSLVGYLPQRAGDLLWAETVAEEIAQLDQGGGLPKYLKDLWRAEDPSADQRHPRDLSSGEQQLLAVALTLARLRDPAQQLLLADEPSRGLDPQGKHLLGQALRGWVEQGGTVLLISQDIDWASTVTSATDRVGLLFQGQLVAQGPAADFWKEGLFYTPIKTRLHQRVAPWK